MLLIFLINLAFAAKMEVQIPEFSTVRRGEAIRLGQVTELKSRDWELNNRLKETILYPAINELGEYRVSSREVAVSIRNRLSFQDLQRVNFSIPETLVFKVKENHLPESSIRFDIAKRAQELCAECEAELDDLRIPDIKTSGEILSTHLDVNQLKTGGAFLLSYLVETSKGRVQYWVTGRIQFYRKAWTTKRVLPSTDKISEKDIEEKRVQVTYLNDALPSREELLGRSLNRMVPMGHLIVVGDIKKEPMLVRGQTIKIILGEGAIEVTTQGVSEEIGFMGEMVKVKTMDHKKTLTGIVVDKGVVKIE